MPTDITVTSRVEQVFEPHDIFVRKVTSHSALTQEEEKGLRDLPLTIRHFPPHQHIAREGDRASACCLVVNGFSYRYKLLPDGRRQILNFNVPGDIPDLQSVHLAVMDHNLAALSSLTVAYLSHEAVHALNARFPRIAGALWRITLVDAAQLRERIVSLGQRDSLSRTAHFLCEMYLRLQAVGLVDESAMELPITQAELADALGMTAIHMNRVLRRLRESRLIETRGRSLVLTSRAGLEDLCGFDTTYLHLTSDIPPSVP